MTEWRAIPGFGTGRYEVSTLGEVRSIPRLRVKGGVLRQHETAGYMRVSLYTLGVDRPKLYLVHRLVLLTFVGECPDGMEALHADGNPTHNALDNLRWASRAENATDRATHGKWRDAMTARQVLSDADAEFIRKNHKVITQKRLAEMFGVHRATIQRIHSGERYV